MSTPPITLTSKVATPGAHVAVIGDADQLAAAYKTGQPVTLTGKHAGETVYLGLARQTYDDGITTETIGLDRTLGESPRFPGHTIAAYLVDPSRLADAPMLADLFRKVEAATLRNAIDAEARADRQAARVEHSEDGA